MNGVQCNIRPFSPFLRSVRGSKLKVNVIPIDFVISSSDISVTQWSRNRLSHFLFIARLDCVAKSCHWGIKLILCVLAEIGHKPLSTFMLWCWILLDALDAIIVNSVKQPEKIYRESIVQPFKGVNISTLDMWCYLWFDGQELWPPLWCLSVVPASGVHLSLSLSLSLGPPSPCMRQSHGRKRSTSPQSLMMPGGHLLMVFCLSPTKMPWYHHMTPVQSFLYVITHTFTIILVVDESYYCSQGWLGVRVCDFFLPGTKCLWVTAGVLENTDRAIIGMA